MVKSKNIIRSKIMVGTKGAIITIIPKTLAKLKGYEKGSYAIWDVTKEGLSIKKEGGD